MGLFNLDFRMLFSEMANITFLFLFSILYIYILFSIIPLYVWQSLIVYFSAVKIKGVTWKYVLVDKKEDWILDIFQPLWKVSWSNFSLLHPNVLSRMTQGRVLSEQPTHSSPLLFSCDLSLCQQPQMNWERGGQWIKQLPTCVNW